MAHIPVRQFGPAVSYGGKDLARVVPNLHVYVPARAFLLGLVAGQPVWPYVTSAALHAVLYATALLAAERADLPQARLRMSRAAGTIALAALVVVAAVAVVTARELAAGQSEVDAADAAATRSDWAETIVHARAAAEALVPGSPWPERGWTRLEAVGHDAEARGDDATAMLAYGAMRAAALATRAPGAGSERWRTKAEDGLARVASSQADAAGPRATAESMLDALRASEPPPTWTLTLLAVAGAAMLGGLGSLVWLGRREERGRKARVAQAVALVGFVAYAVVLLGR